MRFPLVGLPMLGCLALAVPGCGGANDGPDPAPAAKTRLEDVDARVLTATTRFGLKMLGEVGGADAGKNLMVSPPSISLALAMAANGAKGETFTAMARTLELQGMTLEEINTANAALMSALQSVDPKVKLSIANSLWSRKGVPFLPDFVQRCRDSYGAEVSELDFADPGAPGIINAWVNKNTNGTIPEIVNSINPDLILFLINAIYFKGAWTDKFDAARTQPAPFTVADGTQKSVPMMHQSGDYRHTKGEGFEAVSLPYGSDGKVSMYLFLPDAGTDLNAFRARVTPENWETWMAAFHTGEGDIALPKFRFAYDVTLNAALKALGMGLAFNAEQADFSGMTTLQAYISAVKHKSFIEVNEEGTEAAAVTSVEVGATAVPIRFQMTFNRPFLFAIRHNPTGTVLFAGTVVDPS